MNNEALLRDLSNISDEYILEAAPNKKIVPFRKKLYKMIAAAASLFLILSGLYTTTAYAKTTSYISLDVNPSIELCLNKWNKVVEIKAYNKEASDICSNHTLKNKNYLDAIEELLCDEAFKAYCQDETLADLSITIVSNNYHMFEREISKCDSFIANYGKIYYTDEETAKQAHDNDCSIGKYAAYEELQKYDSSINIEDCKEMTMQELHQEIASHHNDSYNEKHYNSSGSTQKHHNSNHHKHHH